jgi:two-component system NarL family response regulator
MAIRILLVDDHELMREGLRAILEKDGTLDVVGEAADGRDAVRQVKKLRPDLVIMDVAMPDLNGIEATRIIKEENPKTRILALSSHPDPAYVTAVLKAGASGYVLKAKAYRELRKAIILAQNGECFLSDELTGVVVQAVRGSDSSQESAYSRLGGRERQVLQLLAEGHSSPEIAARLHVASSTVETHRRNLMRKLDIHSIAELTKYAIREGLTRVEE